LKAYRFRVLIIALVLMGLVTHVFADDGGDPTDVNKLLSDGTEEITADKLLLSVPFDDQTQWETYNGKDNDLKIADGVYHTSLTGNIATFGRSYKSQTDTVMQVKATQVSEESNNAYGVMCRTNTNGNGDGYYFLISGDGSYTISLVKGSVKTLVKWTESKAINKGQDENELTVVCVKNYLAMYVNDVLVAETTDDTFTKGDQGLSISGFADDANIAVDFDDVRIWSASLASGADSVAETKSSTDLPDTLTSYNGKPKEAIAELEQLGVIPSGSSQIFNENHAYFAGQGSWFTPLARSSPHKNIVMGGELTFTVGSTTQFESCTLSSRINTNSQGSAITYIDVGIGNDGYAYILDRFSEAKDGNFTIGSTPLNLKNPHHLLFMLIDDTATVYVDGSLEISDFKVAERSGTYGITLIGQGPKARCDGRNIWAFAVPSVKAGECVINSAKAANKRTGPGTTFDSAGQLAAGDEVGVTGQAKGADGKSWWQLDDESWVRADLVNAVGDCAGVPIVKP